MRAAELGCVLLLASACGSEARRSATTESAASEGGTAPAATECTADVECAIVSVGRVEWCNVGGEPIAVPASEAASMQARLDEVEVTPEEGWWQVCPLALPRCAAGRCELERDWAACGSSSDCVRVEHGPVSAPLVNACRIDSSERFARSMTNSSGMAEVRITREGVACVEGRCTAPDAP